ncbi:MAG: hypothetical protein HYY17_02680 [Planctomycetes bacterium]|nr:hypothetical protein [Planctomycetota bacterium]
MGFRSSIGWPSAGERRRTGGVESMVNCHVATASLAALSETRSSTVWIPAWSGCAGVKEIPPAVACAATIAPSRKSLADETSIPESASAHVAEIAGWSPSTTPSGARDVIAGGVRSTVTGGAADSVEPTAVDANPAAPHARRSRTRNAVSVAA